MSRNKPTGEYHISSVNFADNKTPEFKEVKNKEWILFGEDDCYPNQLMEFYNKSSKHNSIINGKVNYIIGKGYLDNSEINKHGETITDVAKKCVVDLEIFGGYYLQIVWDAIGRVSDFYHVSFQNVRKTKEGNYKYSKDFKDRKEEVKDFDKFNPNNPKGSQILSYKEYRPGNQSYALPGYLGCINYIETDIEISKYNLSAIKNGMIPSKFINFFNGEPTEDKKRDIERRFSEKFTGSENAGRIMIGYNTDPNKAPVISDLSATDLDKHFDLLNKTVQQEILSGHSVTSPSLFGIKTEGQLGGTTELQMAYEIFKNTYVQGKQFEVDRVFGYLMTLKGMTIINLEPVSPIGFNLAPEVLVNIAPRGWIMEQLGIDESKYIKEGIVDNKTLEALTTMSPLVANNVLSNLTINETRNLAALPPIDGGDTVSVKEEDGSFTKMSKTYTESEVASWFDEVGRPISDFVILRENKFDFSEVEAMQQSFDDITNAQDSAILDILKKDKRATPEVIAKALKVSEDLVKERLKDLENRRIITPKVSKIGVDKITERNINTDNIDSKPKALKIEVRYMYVAKPGHPDIIPTTREFCRRLMELKKTYTRTEIEQFSQRLGYSVFERKGGFWGDSKECRHNWKQITTIERV
jgi:DNA-binding Lrp family transcriptional regulator